MMRRTVMALALAGGVVAASAPVAARAGPSFERSSGSLHSPSRAPAHAPRQRGAVAAHAGSDPAWHPFAVPPDLEQRRRDGHMTPEERRLLRQHIEDAVRELYGR